jgi:transcriptional regulator with XRE-family HTH domain
MPDALTESLAATLLAARRTRGLTAAALAERSGVSRAMIGKIERGDAQPTAALLGRLSGALGMTLSELVARAEGGAPRRLLRRDDQPTWTDPATGYQRRAVAPPGGPTELVEVVLPPGAEVAYPAESYTFVAHLIWVLDGQLRLREGDDVHDLAAGDCLELGPAQPCGYANASGRPCRYLVVLTRRPG